MNDFITPSPVAATDGPQNEGGHTRRYSPAAIVGVSVASAAIVAGAIAALIVGFGSHTAHAAPISPVRPVAPATPAAPVSPSTPSTPVAPITPSNPVTPPVTPVLPTAFVQNLQRELGQLNYYEGSVNGVMDQQTVQAIKYLQRDADLPQTGQFNQITYLALQNFLQNGNNQMGN